MQEVPNINACLLNAPIVFLESRNKPLSNVPVMTTGNRPADGGHLIIEAEDYKEFITKEPTAAPYIKSLADLYDETVMPSELRTAHQQNDRAVMEAYGFWGKLNSESACVAELMKMYRTLTNK